MNCDEVIQHLIGCEKCQLTVRDLLPDRFAEINKILDNMDEDKERRFNQVISGTYKKEDKQNGNT